MRPWPGGDDLGSHLRVWSPEASPVGGLDRLQAGQGSERLVKEHWTPNPADRGPLVWTRRALVKGCGQEPRSGEESHGSEGCS